jgi:hypothetical protein
MPSEVGHILDGGIAKVVYQPVCSFERRRPSGSALRRPMRFLSHPAERSGRPRGGRPLKRGLPGLS